VLDFVEPMQVSGRVTRVAGLVMECVGLKLAVGSACTDPAAHPAPASRPKWSASKASACS
jgi:flagellum-specific ATP synthase